MSSQVSSIAPSPRLAEETIRRVDAYAEETLSCPATVARAGGVHLIATPHRARPGWNGYVLPVVALAFDQGAVVAARPDLASTLRMLMGSDAQAPRLDRSALRRLLRAVERLAPHSFTLAGDFRVADIGSFRPSATESRAEAVPWNDPAVAHLRHRFDGEVFGVRGPRGTLVSWAALKRKGEDLWEVAVATEADYRGRGYARDVVSAATHHTLDQGRLCAYVHDHENSTSAFVARTIGYQIYAEIVLAEY